jgi:hypothetical protein
MRYARGGDGTVFASRKFGFPGERMRPVHHLPEMILGDMGVDFRGGDIGMAQQGLHRTQVRTAFHQMRGEGMAQDMRRNFGGI